jgi:hypothetical protein
MITTTEPYTSSLVIVYTGPKRSGKSLLMVHRAVWDMASGRTVWSNIPIHTPKFLVDKGFPYREAKPLDWNSFYLLSEEYQEGTVCLDEAVYTDDSRSSLTMKNKLINTIMNQVGHRSLNVYYTVKSHSWMDRRLVFETDLRIECFDLALSTWGRKNGLTRGKVIKLIYYDLSGAVTGYRYEDSKRPFNTKLFNVGDKYWDAYDTKRIVGLEEVFTGVKVDLQQRVISNKKAVDQDLLNALYQIASQVRENSADMTGKCSDYWDLVYRVGIDGDPRHLGKYMRLLGVDKKPKRGGDIYDFSKLVVPST